MNGIVWGAIRNEITILRDDPARPVDGGPLERPAVLRLHRPAHCGQRPGVGVARALQCYGGLGADGHPRPDGVDVPFFCQCYLPHDPACPPDMVQISVGRNWNDRDDLFEYVALGHGVPRSTEVPMSAFQPFGEARPPGTCAALDVPLLPRPVRPRRYAAGRREGAELWVDRFTGSNRKGWPPLALDEHGGGWRPVRHRRRRRGFQWKPMDDRSAAHHCGVASWDFDRAHRGSSGGIGGLG